MTKKKFAVLLAGLLLSFTGYAQYSLKSQYIYWWYRERLKNQFMIVGSAQGEGLPAPTRELSGTNSLKYGDNSIFLGHYLAVLATEYRLLKNSQQWKALEATKRELFYAMQAFYRLDFLAECSTPYSLPCSVNGFWLRDDVDADFDQRDNHLAHLNRYNVFFDMMEVKWVESDYQHVCPTSKEMSQDHFIHMLLGLSMVVKLVDDGQQVLDENGHPLIPALSYPDNLSDFKTSAKNAIRRMANRVDNDLWIIKRPQAFNDPNSLCDENAEDGVNVHPGARMDVSGFGEGVNLTCQAIIGEHFSTSPLIQGNWNSIPDFSDELTPDNRHMALTLAALSNGWWPDDTERIIRLLAMDKQSLVGEMEGVNWQSFYLYLWKVVHGTQFSQASTDVISGDINEIFNTVPCMGPGAESPGNHRWHSSCRWRVSASGQMNGENGFPLMKNNGLDYMLMHNLYLLGTTSQFPKYRPYVTPRFDDDITGSSTKVNISGLDELIARGRISGAIVQFFASREIDLEPGFTAELGSKFTAQLHFLDCDRIDYLAFNPPMFQEAGTAAYGSLDGISPGEKEPAHLYTVHDVQVFSREGDLHILNPEGNFKKVIVQDYVGKVIYQGNLDEMMVIPMNGRQGVFLVRFLDAASHRVLTKRIIW